MSPCVPMWTESSRQSPPCQWKSVSPRGASQAALRAHKYHTGLAPTLRDPTRIYVPRVVIHMVFSSYEVSRYAVIIKYHCQLYNLFGKITVFIGFCGFSHID